MSKRIKYSSWGRGCSALSFPAYAMLDTDNDRWGLGRTVAESIARKNHKHVVNCRPDGTALDGKGKPEARHYQVTLGSKCRGGGYTDLFQFWIAIPVSR